MSRSEYENPVEQVMYILGFKQAPQFETVMHAIAYGANPGILDAVDEMATYGAIDANFHALAKAVETVKEVFGFQVPLRVKNEVYRITIDEFDENHFGGKWFECNELPSEGWTITVRYSPLFVRGSTYFCFPTPYLRVLKPILSITIGTYE